MGVSEHLGVFLSIVLGLAISDLCISFNRVLDAGARVRWDWLSPMAALVALLKILTQWWQWFGFAELAKGRITFEAFLLVMAGGVLMFLVAAAALPDRADEAVVDLRGYYARTSRRYWLLFAAQYMVLTAIGIWAQTQLLHAGLGWPLAFRLVTPAIAVILAFVPLRGLHTLGLAGFIVDYSLQLAGSVLGPR
jgi:hypothetical protein